MCADTLEAARRGHADAKAFDLGLRELEARERESRLGRVAALQRVVEPGSADALRGRVERLEREIASLSHYQRAVRSSRAWQLAQMVRRALGRRTW